MCLARTFCFLTSASPSGRVQDLRDWGDKGLSSICFKELADKLPVNASCPEQLGLTEERPVPPSLAIRQNSPLIPRVSGSFTPSVFWKALEDDFPLCFQAAVPQPGGEEG